MVIGITVANSEIEMIQLGVVADRVPYSAATAPFPPLTAPGFSGSGQCIIFKPLGRVTGHGVKTPQPLSGHCIATIDVASGGRHVRAPVTDNDLTVKNTGRPIDVAMVLNTFRTAT